MTVLAAAPTPTLRPVPWRRLGWVAWRRYRASLVATGAVLAIVAVYLIVRGEQMRSAYATLQACTPASAATCRFGWLTFHNTYGDLGPKLGLLVFLPALIGAFAGAPVLARELETGTFRYAWTQCTGRMRWLVALLVPGALGVAAAGAALGALIGWYEQPLVDSGIQQRLHESLFALTGIAVVGWTVLAFAIGALAGLLLRRVIPTLVATLAVWTGLAFEASTLRGGLYERPLVTSHMQLAAGDLSVRQWWTHRGVPASEAQINHALQAIGIQNVNGGGDFQAGPGSSGSVDPVHYLVQHGFSQWTSYQPDSRYWPFQGIEFGWLVALSLVLLGATVWLVRRRGA